MSEQMQYKTALKNCGSVGQSYRNWGGRLQNASSELFLCKVFLVSAV